MEVVTSTPTPSEKCKLEPGTFVGKYEVVEKIGKGLMCTVYATKTTDMIHAVKIYNIDLEKYYRNEVQMLQRLAGSDYVMSCSDLFAYVCGVSGAIYPCITMELLGDSIADLISYCKDEFDQGLPMPMVLRVARDMFRGLAHMHERGVIHADIKPDNLLLTCKVTENLTAEQIHVKIVDFGSSSTTESIFSENVGTTGYIAPEIIIHAPFGTPADIWSAFTLCFELISGAALFDVFFECDIDYGDIDESTVSMEPIAVYEPCKQCPDKHSSCSCGLCDECGDHADCDNISLSEGSSDGPEHRYARNYCYLLLVAKVIGYPPSEFTERARDYYNRKGKLITNPDVVPTTISALLNSNYEMDEKLVLAIEEFLLRGLKYDPAERITASDALLHTFLSC